MIFWLKYFLLQLVSLSFFMQLQSSIYFISFIVIINIIIHNVFCYHFPIYYSIHHYCIVTLLLVLPLRFLLFIYIYLVHVLAIFIHPFIYLGYLLPYYHIYDIFLLFYCYLQLYIIYECIITLFTSVRKISPKLIYVILYNITKIY